MSDETRKFHINEPQDSSGELWERFNWREGIYSWDLNITEPQSPMLPPYDDEPPQEVEPAKPRNRRKRRPPKRRASLPEVILAALLYVAGVLVASFFLATVSWQWANDVLALSKTPKAVSFTVSDEPTLDAVASQMKQEGLIEYEFLFKTFASLTHKAERVTPGTYQLNTEMDYSALLTNISSTSSSRETVNVTIPEGYTVEEIFALLEQKGVCPADKLLSAAEKEVFPGTVLDDVSRRTGVHRLEGYLFPDTYQFYKGADAKNVILRMLNNFGERFSGTLLEKQKASGMTRDEILTLASIIEKETTGDDRHEIASVIYNRLNNPEHDSIRRKLQMDSTVQYILEERKDHLTNADIAIESPYNTYLVEGLPVGPICNPGLDSLLAAVNPSNTDYYYFMLGDDGDDHFFTDRASFEAFKEVQSGN